MNTGEHIGGIVLLVFGVIFLLSSIVNYLSSYKFDGVNIGFFVVAVALLGVGGWLVEKNSQKSVVANATPLNSMNMQKRIPDQEFMNKMAEQENIAKMEDLEEIQIIIDNLHNEFGENMKDPKFIEFIYNKFVSENPSEVDKINKVFQHLTRENFGNPQKNTRRY